jgi:hypothetical protein
LRDAKDAQISNLRPYRRASSDRGLL